MNEKGNEMSSSASRKERALCKEAYLQGGLHASQEAVQPCVHLAAGPAAERV